MRRELRIDRTTVAAGLGVLLFIAAYAGTVALSNRYYVIAAPDSSIYSAAPQGLKVFYTYLQELGHEPKALQTWERLPARATIVAAGPFTQRPTTAEAESLATWVRSGGRLVVVGAEAEELTGRLGLGGSPGRGDASETLRPLFPGAYSRGVSEVVPGPDRLLVGDSGWVAHLKDYSGQVLVTQKVGDGEVVWLAGPYALSNAGIGSADNGRLAVIIATAGGGQVYFDEYHHGFVTQAGVWGRLGTGGRSAVLLLAGALALALLGWGTRIGPVIAEPAEPEARGGAYIGQLAELYRKAGARGDALITLEEGLTRALSRSGGTVDAGLARYPSAAEALSASRAAREAGPVRPEDLVGIARRLGRARQEVEGYHG